MKNHTLGPPVINRPMRHSTENTTDNSVIMINNTRAPPRASVRATSDRTAKRCPSYPTQTAMGALDVAAGFQGLQSLGEPGQPATVTVSEGLKDPEIVGAAKYFLSVRIIQQDRIQRRLHRLLLQDLGATVTKTSWGSWMTTSSLPHEIRIESSAGTDFVRVSAGVVIDVRQTKALLETINDLNGYRALTKRMWVDGKVLVVAEQPLASLRRGDLEHLVSAVLCCARLDASLLAMHGGRVTTDVARDYVSELNSWSELLQASGTATERELAVWIDEMTGSDCWLDNDSDPEGGPFVVVESRGTQLSWPFNLMSLFRDVEDLMATLEDEHEAEEDDELELDEGHYSRGV